MNGFRNILVGVDLESADRTLSGDLTPQNQEAVERGIDLAERNRAKLCFATVLDGDQTTDRLIHDALTDHSNVFDEAHALLSAIASRAQQRGISTETRVLLGKGWVRMIQEVLQHQHDLVIVGSRGKGFVDQLLFGSTAIKLLRNCPCPVWVTKPLDGVPLTSVLVAHDLGPVGHHALEIGVALCQKYDLQLHVLHSVEHLPLGGPTGPIGSGDITAELSSSAGQHILNELSGSELARTPKINVAIDAPETAILQAIDEHSIDLVIMGTIGRSGLAGILTGNTAERLLPRLQCSLLALKPEDFQSPIPPESKAD